MFFVITVWFVLSLVIASAAGQRGRSVVGWFLLSILTTPLLAGIFLLFPPLRDLTLSVDDNALQESISKGLSIEPPRKRGIGRLIVVLAILSFVIVVIPTINNMANKSPTTTAEDRAREAEAAEMAARERHVAIIKEATRKAADRADAPQASATAEAIAMQTTQKKIEDARALTAEQWAPYLQLSTQIQIGIKCKVLDDIFSANIAGMSIGTIMTNQQIQNGIYGDTKMVVAQEMAKAAERGRLLVENKSDPGFCSRFFSDPADRARLRQTVNDLVRLAQRS